MLYFCSPVDSPAFINQLGKSFPEAQRGITFHSVLVSNLHQRLALFFDTTGVSTFAKASVISSMKMSVRKIFSGFMGLFLSAGQACIMTSSKPKTPTSSVSFLVNFKVGAKDYEVSLWL